MFRKLWRKLIIKIFRLLDKEQTMPSGELPLDAIIASN